MAPILISKEGVRIHVFPGEHLPPHIHAFVGEDDAMINIRTGELIIGEISGKKLRIVQEWLKEDDNWKWVEEKFYVNNPGLRPGTRNSSGKRKK